MANSFYGLTNAKGMSVGGGYGDGVESAFHECLHMAQELNFVDGAIRFARSADGRAAKEAEFRISGRLGLQGTFLRDALDITEGEQSFQAIVRIHHEKFMDADVFGKKSIGSLDGIVPEIALTDGENAVPLDHGLAHSPIGKAGPHTMAGQKTE